MWVFIPKLLIIVIEAHKGKHYLKKKAIKSRLEQSIHTVLRDTAYIIKMMGLTPIYSVNSMKMMKLKQKINFYSSLGGSRTIQVKTSPDFPIFL
jgi:hypothetical protein